MLKKLMTTTTAIIFTSLLFVSVNVKAATFADNQTVDKNKSWTIHFNEDIVIDDLTKQGIIVTNSKGNPVNVNLSLGHDNKTIIVNAPADGYAEGENYKLRVINKVHSKSNKNLKQKVLLNFNIKKTQLSVNDITPPTGIIAKATSSNEIQIQWNPVSQADYYHVYFSNSINGKYISFQNSDGSNKPLKWYDDYSAELIDIAPKITVYFKVTAVKNGIESKYSDIVSATTLSGIRFFPELSDVPQPTGIEYSESSLSSDETLVHYLYSGSALPNNFFNDYCSLLETNGWILCEKDTASGEQEFYFEKGDNLVLITLDGNDVLVMGNIH